MITRLRRVHVYRKMLMGGCMRVHGVHMGAWGCTLPSTAAARRTHRSPERKKIRPLTGTPRVLSWRWEVAMILVYRLAGILRIRRNNGFELQSLEWRCPAADDRCWCWWHNKCHCVQIGECRAVARRAVCACRMQFQKRLRSPQRVQPVTATACLGRVCRCRREAASPRGQRPPGERGKAAANAGKRGGNAERGKPPRNAGAAAIPCLVSALPVARTAVPAVYNWLYRVRRGMQIGSLLDLLQLRPCTFQHFAVGLLPCRIFSNLPQIHGILCQCPSTSFSPDRPIRSGNRLRIFPAIAIQRTNPILFLRIQHHRNLCRLLIPMSSYWSPPAPVRARARGGASQGFQPDFFSLRAHMI